MIHFNILLPLVAFYMFLFYQKGEKHACLYKIQKWLDVMLLISRYHSKRLSPDFIKMCLKDKQTATEDGMC